MDLRDITRRTLADSLLQPDWLLQQYSGFTSEIPYWEATVSATCCRQARSTTAQSLAHAFPPQWSTSLAERRVKLALLHGLQVGSRSGSGVGYLSAYCVPVSRLPGRSHCNLRSADQWTMFVPEPRLWQSALGFFTVCALASGTPCLSLFVRIVTLICHWRLSGGN